MVNCAEADIYKDKLWTVRSEPWHVCGTWVVALEGRAGGFAAHMLEIVEVKHG